MTDAADADAAPDDPDDPIVFPGEKVERLSAYCDLVQRIEAGDMEGALEQHQLTPREYAKVVQVWAARLATDPALRARLDEMQGA